jgi:hypothetical protein
MLDLRAFHLDDQMNALIDRRQIFRNSIRHPNQAPLCSSVSSVVLFAACLFLALTGCGAGVPKHTTWSNATGAEQYERLMWKAIRDQDWKSLQHRLAPLFVGVSPAGRAMDRVAWVEYWQGVHVSDFSLGEVTVQPAGADMVVTYVLHLTGNGGAQLPPALRIVSVWQGVKTEWILTASSATPISE